MPPADFALFELRYASHVPEPLTRWLLALTLLLAGASLYLQVFIFPATPRLAAGDQAIYLHHGTRMLAGQIIYRDYDHFTLPGTDLLYAALFRGFGVRAWIPQVLLVLTGVSIAWLTIVISQKLMVGGVAFLVGLFFLALPFSSYLDATHHWYSTLADMSALAIAIEKRTLVRLACAGILWGLGTCFSQSTALGALGFALFLLWERSRRRESWASLLKKEGSFFMGFLPAVTAPNLYFVWRVGLRRYLYYTVVFVAKYYPADRFNTWRVYLRDRPDIHSWVNWPDLVAWPFLHVLIPLVYVFFFLAYRRAAKSQSEQPWERLMLVNITGVSLFLTISSAPAWNRLYTVSAPGLILFVWLADSYVRKKTLSRILWATVLILLVLRPILTQTRWKAYLNLPTGRTAFLDPQSYEKFEWIAARTAPNEYFFGDQLVCFALRLQNPARVSFLRPTDYTRPEEVQNVIEALQVHQVRFVSWYAGLNLPVDRPGNHLAPLLRYLHEHYRIAQIFSNQDEIWERKL